ncbi:hypothetical protein FO519_009719 [Halicephalobus sp. NKZ332]|nr:hypothetical protein FO519_009719 [Halicephalobus sp. NKZ332]
MRSLIFIFLLPVASGITCYRGIDIKLPGAKFDQSMASIGCRNADYCLRSFGTINGQTGSFASCVTREKASDTCKDYPACTQKTYGSGDQASNFQTCCCKTDLCNGVDFTGALNTPAPTDSNSPTTSMNSNDPTTSTDSSDPTTSTDSSDSPSSTDSSSTTTSQNSGSMIQGFSFFILVLALLPLLKYN